MAWKPPPDVAALRAFAKKFDRPVVVTFSIARGRERFHVTTSGETKALCKLAGAFGDEIVRAVNEGQIAPPATEPFLDPPGSTTWVKKDEG